MILRNAYKGIRQIIIDPEGEYENVVNGLGGKVINKENFNILYIFEKFAKNNKDFLYKKINSVTNALCESYNIKDFNMVKRCVSKAYKKYGITNDIDSLYKMVVGDTFYTKPKYREDFPSIYDLKQIAKKEFKETNEDFIKLKNIGINANKRECNMESELYSFNLKNKTTKEITNLMKLYIPFIYEMIKEETLIYFDEIWRLIANTKDSFVIKNIYDMFKTLRKKKAGIILVSQDITDLFNVDNGNLGKSILNNSNMKVFFKMEWTDLEVLERLKISKEKLDKIKGLDRGTCYINLGNTNFNLEVRATSYEQILIEGEKKHEKNISGYE